MIASFMKLVGTLVRGQFESRETHRDGDHQVSQAYGFIAERYSEKTSLSDLTQLAGMSEDSAELSTAPIHG